ncbi:MAG: redoxin domain-containing protein [Erysipelothrix sp.]
MKTKVFGISLNLKESELVLGKKFPYFDVETVYGDAFSHVNLLGKKTVISTFPDINTKVCSIQTRKFIESFQNDDRVQLVSISTNSNNDFLHWCAQEGLKATMISDKSGDIAKRLGVWIPIINKYARTVMIVDELGYIEKIYVTKNITDEPDYKAVIGYLNIKK